MRGHDSLAVVFLGSLDLIPAGQQDLLGMLSNNPLTPAVRGGCHWEVGFGCFRAVDRPVDFWARYKSPKLLVAVQEATGLRRASRFVNCVRNGDQGMILSSRKIYRDRGLEDVSAHLFELSRGSVVSLRSHHPVRHSEAEPRSW